MTVSPKCFLMVLMGGLYGLSSAVAVDAVVTFNEVLYHSPVGSEASEWIELHNQMSIRVDVSGWRISGGVDFLFPEGTVMEPKSEIVVGQVAGAVGVFAGRLDNGGELLELRDRNDRVMDRLDYGDDAPWPVGADGSGCTLAKRRPSLASEEAQSWGVSSRRGGSPGEANVDLIVERALVFSEVGLGVVELQQRGSESYDTSGLRVENASGRMDSLAEMVLGESAFHVMETSVAQPGEALFLFGKEGQLVDAVRVRDRPQARLPHAMEWHFVERMTLGETNVVDLREEIVIHEIMYHFPPNYDQPGTVENEFQERDEEWVEFYNRSERDVDVSGWEIDGGIRFLFPEGTILAPGGYVVVARDAGSLGEKYSDVVVLGDFAGNLSDGGDTIVLRDAMGNVADRVRYVDGGRWPWEADGGGSSLQLRDPWADNAIPEAWRASDESDKSEWVSLQYEGRGAEPSRSNNPSHFHEFLMGLLDAGEVMVDDVSVLEDPHGAAIELMKNGGFENKSIFTGVLTDWRMLGTHAGSMEEAGKLRVRADGSIEHTYNNVSSTFRSGHRLAATQTYAISLKAKWLKGCPQLNTRLYLNRLPKTHVLPIPDRLGSPGEGAGGNSGPTMDGLRVEPLQPVANEAMSIAIAASDRQGIDALTLHYKTDNGAWREVPMALEGDVYTGRIPGQRSGVIVQFYIRARDGEKAVTEFPAGGEDSRALLRIGAAAGSAVSQLDLVMLEEEHDFMRRPEHAVSNGRVGGSLIIDGEDYHVDVGVRLRSSPYGRRGDRVGYNIALGKEHRFRGVHDSIAIDRGSVMPNGTSSGFFEVKPGAGVNELVVNQIAQRARGIPTTYEDVVYVTPPRQGEASLAQLRMARYGANFLEDQYENGARGATHKFELIYHPTTTIDGKADGLKGPYSAVLGIDLLDMRDDKEAYRFNFIPTNNRDRDDFTGIIRLGDAMSSRTDALRRERIPQAIDVDQWMRTFAFQSLIGVADTYNMGLEHNLVLYTRPSDGRVLAFPWDLDHAFYYVPQAGLLGRGGTNLAQFIGMPENRRLFYGHLNDIIATAFNESVMRSWIEHLNDVTENSYDQRMLDYMRARGDFVRAELRSEVDSRFLIATNGGVSFDVDSPTVTLSGRGWIDVRNIRNDSTGRMLDLTWTDVNVWEAEIPLSLGENVIALQAIDFQGNDLGTIFSPGRDVITVRNTGKVAAATAENLKISEILYHPVSVEEEEEFVELQNTSEGPVDLTGVRFTRGIAWEAEAGTQLPAGAVGIVVQRKEAFPEGVAILGVFVESRLSNRGETLRLEDRTGRLIQEVQYDDSLPWPEESDGEGYALVTRSPQSAQDGYGWRASRALGGSPGVVNETDALGEQDLLAYAMGSTPHWQSVGGNQLSLRLRTLADDVAWTLQASVDLETWAAVELDLRSRNQDADWITLTWTLDPDLSYYRVFLQHQKP